MLPLRVQLLGNLLSGERRAVSSLYPDSTLHPVNPFCLRSERRTEHGAGSEMHGFPDTSALTQRGYGSKKGARAACR
jgi:hypothetical protein